MSRNHALAGLAALLAAVGAPKGAAPADALSPGSIALLVISPAFGPAEIDLCRQGLASPSAEVRGAAARVARVRGAQGLVADLARAVAAETDAAAAIEEMLALGWLADASADDSLFAAARRFDGGLDGWLAHSIGVRGAPALAAFERLAALELQQSAWSAFFQWATRRDPGSLAAAVDTTLAHSNAQAWAALLELDTRNATAVGDAALARAVRSGSARIREETYYDLLRRQDGGDSIDPTTKAALGQTAEAAAPPADAAAAVAFEFLERSFGRSPVDVSALLSALEPDALQRIPLETGLLARLRGQEREVFGERRFSDRDWVGKRKKEKPVPSAADRDKPDGRRIRTASDFPPGVVSDVLRLTGCELPKMPVAWNGLEAQFEGDAVKHIGFYPMHGPPACERAVRTLLLMSLVPSDRPPLPGQTHMLILPMDTGFTSCVDHATLPRPLRASTDDDRPVEPQTIRQPRKTRNVLPQYPAKARNERRSGVVYIESVIDPTGCIRSSEVLSAPHVDLAGEAIRTVTQWRYTPTLLNGQPVPVIMTITVNFRLN